MKFLFLFVIFMTCFANAEKAYIDNIEDDDAKISVFTIPGQTWKHCPQSAAKCPPATGWLDRDSGIEILSAPKEYKTKDPETGDTVYEFYTKVKFKYSRANKNGKIVHQEGEGFIPSNYISKQKTSALFSVAEKVPNEKKEPCPPKNTRAQAQFSEIKKVITPLVKPVENLSIVQKADQLTSIVGFCPLKPPNQFSLPQLVGNKNTYDSLIKSEIDKNLSAKNIPQILDEKNKPITKNNLIDIDALARTLYGEMAICYKNGLQYPMAVAKIILNRAEATNRHKEFIKPPHDDAKSSIAKVCTTASQFSMWLKKTGGKKNNPLHHGLCPPQKENSPYWNGKSAVKYESDLWKNSVRIATEAVLHPTQFKRRTASVDGYFYTSGMGQFLGMNQQKKVQIEGKFLDNNRCMEIWKEAK